METLSRHSESWPRLHAWLSPADMPCKADLIFVLAGGMHRKDFALELFRQGLALRILFSVGRFEIRRFSKMPLPVPLDLLKIAQELPPPERHYFAYFRGQEVLAEHVPPGTFGTLTEIEALARWLRTNHGVRSVLVISSDTHLRRIRMCCRSLLNPNLKLAFLAAQIPQSERTVETHERVQSDIGTLGSSSHHGALRDALLELFKLSVYWVLLRFR